MSKYTVKTFLKYDNQSEVSYLQIRGTIPVEGSADDAEELASGIASGDKLMRSHLHHADGFAVVAYEDGEPFVNFEHDGFRLNVWRNEEIAEQLW